MEVIDRGSSSASLRHLLRIFGCFMNLLGPKSREVPVIMEIIENLFQQTTSASILETACDILCHSTMTKATDDNHPLGVFMPFLKTNRSYDSFVIIEKAARYAKSLNRESVEVVQFMPIGMIFFETFYGITCLEKNFPGMTHESMRTTFPAPHDRALELLSHPELRMFAPVFALLDKRAPIPEVLEALVSDTQTRLRVR
jgi:hypothetical protein